MHAKPDLRVFLEWMIAGSGSVITDVIWLTRIGRDMSKDKNSTTKPSSYNRSNALAYARSKWTSVSTDNYIGVGSSPGYKQVPAGTIFVRKTADDPGTEVARLPDGSEIPLSELEDCAHFISCCIGEPPNGTGGGLKIGSEFSGVYGYIAARRLFDKLKSGSFIDIVGAERMNKTATKTRIDAGEIGAGDLVFYYFEKNGVPQAEPGHVGLYLGDAGKHIACHTYCRCDQANDYDQSWESVNAAYAYTLAKIK